MASEFINLLQGKPITHVWRGYGSAIFLEFGELVESNDSPEHAIGELGLMIEWSWRVECPRSILCGSWSSERRWPGMFKQLLGSHVTKVEFFGNLPEISISLSNGLRVVSFMTAEGQPSWALISHRPKRGTLFSRNGRLCVEMQYS